MANQWHQQYDQSKATTGDPMKTGRYRHYKGNEYIVLGVARHSETDQQMVVYRPDYGDRGLWVRPKAMFLETVSRDGHEVHRFEYIGPAGDEAATS